MLIDQRFDPSYDGERFEVVVSNNEIAIARYRGTFLPSFSSDPPSHVLRWLADVAEANGQ